MGEQLPEGVVHQLRKTGLLEGDELTPIWERLQRDRELGAILLNRHAVRLGRDGDRLYVRLDAGRPDYDAETTTLDPALRPVCRRTDPHEHDGVHSTGRCWRNPGGEDPDHPGYGQGYRLEAGRYGMVPRGLGEGITDG